MKIQYGPKQKFTKSPILIIEESLFFFFLFIGMKYFNYMTKSLFKIDFFSVNLLILIFRQISITGLPFPQTFISMRHPVI